jgi:F0F1-type ATP synthase assembly protein I
MPRSSLSDAWAKVAFYTGLSFIAPVSAIAGYALGWFLDEHLHTAPVLASLGVLAGVALGITEIIRIVMRREKNAGGR